MGETEGDRMVKVLGVLAFTLVGFLIGYGLTTLLVGA
jgi:hypothetical protein